MRGKLFKRLSQVFVIISGIALLSSSLIFLIPSGVQVPDQAVEPEIIHMLLTSPSFENGAAIPSKFTCDGGNINPELLVQNVPNNTVSLALIVDDPDAPNGNFLHWMAWNIDPRSEIIKEESVPQGLSTKAGVKTGSIEGKNDAGRIGYMGPCPPSGTHRYFFKLYALDSLLDLDGNITKPELEASIAEHLIEKAELVGTYSRG